MREGRAEPLGRVLRVVERRRIECDSLERLLGNSAGESPLLVRREELGKLFVEGKKLRMRRIVRGRDETRESFLEPDCRVRLSARHENSGAILQGNTCDARPRK